MNIMFTSDGKWIPPHLNHTLKSYFYSTELACAIVTDQVEVISSYPSDIHMSNLDYEFLKEISNNIRSKSRCSQNKKESFTYTFLNYFGFIVTPIYFERTYKGYMIAGPFVSSKLEQDLAKEHLHMIESSKKEQMETFIAIAVLKESPRVFYLSQTMQHLMEKAIYIGPHTTEPKTSYISKEDMRVRSDLSKPFDVILKVKDMVLKKRPNDAITYYKKSMVFGDLFNEEGINTHNELKAEMISLLTLIYEHVLKTGYHSPYLEHYRIDFTNRIMNSRTLNDLFACGECIIKKYGHIISQSSTSSKSKSVKEALHYIHENYQQKFKIEDICKSIFVSKAHLSVIFKDEMSMTINNYIKNYRIKQSQYLLLHTKNSILDIALETGFDNANYYSNVFKSMTKMTPRQYRLESKESL